MIDADHQGADDDDNDDDDDDDDAKSDADEDKAEEAADQKAEKELEAAQEAALEAARRKQRYAQEDLEAFKDDKAFDKKIAAQVKLITNETQSPTLSSFLGSLRTELRLYSKPSYPAYLEGQVAAAEKKVADLEKELGKTTTDAPKEKAATKGGSEEKPKPEEAKKKSASEESQVEKLASEAQSASAADVAQKAGETWAISFFANIALLAVVFAMANAGNVLVRSYTWFLIDQVIAIFLAVMYFQAFDSLLDFGSLDTHSHVLASIVHAVIMLTMVLVVAYRLRRDDLALAVLCGAGAHIVSFSSIHAAATVQNKWWMSVSYNWAMAIFGMFVLALGLATIGYLVYTAKKRANLLEDDGFMDKTDDLENDFGSMAFSVVFTMFMRYLLTGHHPVDDDTDFDHTREDRVRMLIYAFVCLGVAAFAVGYTSKKAVEAAESKNYALKRVMTFLTTVAAMNVAWAFLYWGEWEFFETVFPNEKVKGRVMFAVLSTVFGGLALIGLARLSKSEGKVAGVTKPALVAVTAVSLVVAWSWELCFDAAVEDMTQGVSHPVGWKIASTLTLFTIIIPVYAYYVKPACARNGASG